ncbi:hypothetical protein ARALYDRAFT_359352 [Arabidopsis lyrata subsp. lyrata]|uniref:OTU domain-containing protein n=1 Tax=Arabidopsis lyrata subsp. lyrata TaxID=81972 RepID=D7MWK7_ARALL|nr:hypothetical protein ARALYDRAFT_359352 [Arabidopsis lyrata subsp. lyrata]
MYIYLHRIFKNVRPALYEICYLNVQQDYTTFGGRCWIKWSVEELEAAGHRVFLLYREIKGNKVSSGALCKQVKSFRSDWRRFLKLEEIEPRHVRNNKRQQKRIERFKEKKKKDKLAKEEEKKNAENNQRRITLVSSIGMEEIDVVGDGNCQFRALSNQLYDDENHYNYIRQQVIEELRAHPERYRRFAEAEAGISYEEYLTSMARIFKNVRPALYEICYPNVQQDYTTFGGRCWIKWLHTSIRGK